MSPFGKLLEFVYLWLIVLDVGGDDCLVIGVCGGGVCGRRCVEVVSKFIYFQPSEEWF